jgi:hypothetical protein
VGFAIIEIQNDRLITSSKFYFQALLSAIALLSLKLLIDDRLKFGVQMSQLRHKRPNKRSDHVFE